MKKRIISLVALLVIAGPLFAQNTYLVNKCKVVKSEKCTIYKYNGNSSAKIRMAGGEYGYGGFSFWDEGAYVTFDLGGQYEFLTFTMAHDDRCSEDVGVVTAYADENKVFDEKVRGYEPPRVHTINVSGAKQLTFKIAATDIEVVVADAVLWKSGQKPVPVTRPVTPPAAPKELVKDMRAYYVSNFMTEVTPDEHYIMLNRQTYEYGLRGNMNMALIGTNKGFAYFNLHEQYSKLSFIVGCHDDLGGGHGSGWVTVKADGKIIEEIEVKKGEIAKQITLDITGCEMLSFHTELIEGNSYAEMAKVMVYPEGYDVEYAQNNDGLAPPDPRLKELPDVCKLISNITPFQVVGKVSKQIYNGSSDHITFSMGGTKYSEGIILYQTASFWDDNVSACATFDMGNEFKYISFTAGYVGKSWNMNEDYLMVYADDELVFSTALIPTYPNQHFIVPINKCRTLRFCNAGSGSLDVAAFGVADIVAYRDKYVENDLFVHPEPDCPTEIDLIDLGLPYIHYVSTMSNYKDEIVRDGSTKKLYYELNGERIYKGFLLQTSTHFSLDCGILGSNNGANATAAAAAGAAAVGASFVATGAAVGGAAVGATLAPMAAFLVLAAGGEAIENSLAAFNTYGEYNSVTFKVGCLSTSSKKANYYEHLMIGADHEVVANIGLYESMNPQEITVPINGCEQLMFWLANTHGTSSQYVIYDIVVSKKKSELNIPIPARMSMPEKREVKTPEYVINRHYERYSSSYKSKEVDNYLSNANSYYRRLCNFIDNNTSHYYVYTYYLESSQGPCKAIQLRSAKDEDHCYNIVDEYHDLKERQLKTLAEMKAEKFSFKLDYAAAMTGLLNMGFDIVRYRNYIKTYNQVLDDCFAIVDALYEEKARELAFIEWVVRNSLTLDGVVSDESNMLCPLTTDDVLPDYPLQHVSYFEFVD